MIDVSSSLLGPDLALVHDILGDLSRRCELKFVQECASTNTSLLQQAADGLPSGHVLLALRQSAGRGRRGRSWYARPGASLTFSLLWRFPHNFPLHGLSLAVGVAVTRALARLGVDGLALKWPNDVLLYGRKLGGVLVETIRAQGETAAVIGIGLNLQEDAERTRMVGQPCASLSDAGFSCSQESLLAALLQALIEVLDSFSMQGFTALQAEWSSRNAFHRLPVRVWQEGREMRGLCLGVDEQGALLLETGGRVRHVWGGELSLRPLVATSQ